MTKETVIDKTKNQINNLIILIEMKKIFFAVMAVAAFAACTGNTTPNDTDSQATDSQAPATESVEQTTDSQAQPTTESVAAPADSTANA